MLRRILISLLSVFLVLPSILPVNEVAANETGNGTTYYVSTLNGDDNNDGTSEENAFYSLEKINNMELGPGDQVLLESGSVFVDGYLHIQGSGAEDAPIIIDSYGEGEKPKLQTNGQGVWYQDYGKQLDNPLHKRVGYVSSSILLYDVEYIEISNLDVSNDPAFEEPYSLEHKMDRTGVAAVAQNKGTINHIHLNNLDIHNIRGNVYNKHMQNGGIYFQVFQPENEEETGIPRFDGVLIEGNTVNDVSRWGIAVGYTVYWDEFLSSEISDETIAKYGSANVVIRNNYIKDSGGDAITTMYLDRPIVEYNVSDGAAKEIGDPDVYTGTHLHRVAAGIWPWKSKDAIFQNNEAFNTTHNQDGQAWDADYGDGVIYQYNYSHNNYGGAIMVCGAQAINTIFRYNISQNDESGILDLPGNPDGHFYNNVFYIKEGTPFIGMTGGVGIVENNIIYNANYDGTEETLRTEDWTKGGSDVTYSHNLYYGFANLPEDDDHALVADPGFLNPGTAPHQTDGTFNATDAFSGYKVGNDSPVINAGKFIPNNATVDFFGNPVGIIPDIGIHEVDADEDVSEIYIENMEVYQDRIINIPLETTVEEFLSNIVRSGNTVVEVQRAGVALDNSATVETGDVFRATFPNTDADPIVYTLENERIYQEYSPEGMEATAGNERAIEPAGMVLDNDTSTIWHTDWSGTDQENIWIALDLGEVLPISMLKYVPRQGGGINGIFTEYSIFVKENETDEWLQVDTYYENTWAVNSVTKYAYFDEVEARYIKLQADEAATDQALLFGSAAEIRVGYEE